MTDFSMNDRSTASIQVSGLDFLFRSVTIADRSPTGQQISAAAGYLPAQEATVLLFLESGELEDIRPDEVVDLTARGFRFLVVESDRLYRLTIDGRRFDWPAPVISGGQVRKLGDISSAKTVFFERTDEADLQLQDHDLIDLRETGIEAFYSRAATWLLNVQGVRLELPTPTIVVRDAMIKAGFDVSQGWIIVLKVTGQPKESVQLDTVIDLQRPGIEKLRLTPRDVSNGETATAVRNEFALLDVDEEFLNNHHASWETLLDGPRRWLVIHDYPVPLGYGVKRIDLALEVPSNYPMAQIDMFYAHPPLVLANGQRLANTEAFVDIKGRQFQRWSRHRGAGAPWLSNTDNVITHLALVEAALLKETAQ